MNGGFREMQIEKSRFLSTRPKLIEEHTVMNFIVHSPSPAPFIC